jgi:large subunit ribosomal protein L23
MAQLENVIVKPLLTEKASLATEQFNRYGFVVQLKSSKHQIKAAVEKLYDVKVLNIKTNITPGKLRKFGRHVSKSGKVKKAFIQIESGQKIEFFKGI